jgi:hypothetical protein
MKRLFQFALFITLTASPIFAYAQATGNAVSQSPLAKCLPPEIKLSDVVDSASAGPAKGQSVGRDSVTVEQRLNELNATCSSENKLVDGNGKQIVFYHLTGCWGNPPEDYQDILQKQRDEINKLKQQYTVIEISCSPSGIRISYSPGPMSSDRGLA